MSKRSRIILLSCVTVLCCVALITAGTLALFTYNRTVTNHLQAGSLVATLTRTELVSTVLDAHGRLVTSADDDPKDFTEQSADNVFGLKSQETVAPGCSFEAAMQLSNGGTVAFCYWVEITGISGDDELQDQLQLTVSINGGQARSATLTSGEAASLLGSEQSPVGTLAVGEQGSFTVKLEFLSAAGNDAQSKTASFDLVVHAVQVTAQQ